MAIKIWTAVKFAASLIPRAIGLDILLAISIITKRGDKIRGAPEGLKELQNIPLKLCKSLKLLLPAKYLKLNQK